MNTSTLELCTDLNLGELPSLFMVYNITISWLYPVYPLNGFCYICYCVTVNTCILYAQKMKRMHSFWAECIPKIPEKGSKK